MSVEKLEALLDSGLIPDQSVEFAQSLVKQFKQNGYLSDKQHYWVGRLSKGSNEETLNDMSGLKAMLDTAAVKLKNPKITIGLAAGTFQFSRAKENSKNPGHLYIKRNGNYIGKVTPQSVLVPAGATQDDIESIKQFSCNPVLHAKEHGLKTGNCCFCNKTLSAEESVSVGYGPVCAKNFGLVH